VSPDPKGMGAVSSDPEGTGSVSPDPLGTGPMSPDPKGTGAITPNPEGPDGDPYRLQPLWVRRYDLGVKLLTPGGKQGRLDVTHGHVRPRPGVHIVNSDRCVVVVLPTPRTTVDGHVGSPRHPSGRDGTPRPANDVEAWHQW